MAAAMGASPTLNSNTGCLYDSADVKCDWTKKTLRGKTMSMASEFKDFAMKGNVVDMAVGIVIGGAFGKIVSSFVADVLMPPIGIMLGNVDFSDLAITLQAASDGGEAVLLKYGVFIQTVVDFIIIAFAIFMVVKAMNSMKKKEEAAPPPAPPEPSKEEVLLAEIRDAIRSS
jgi:large conductance mechanosensitive channel